MKGMTITELINDGYYLDSKGKLMRNYKMERLMKGETFITHEKGNSMAPLIKSGQDHKLAPCIIDDVEIGDIVYCKVKGRFYTHIVKAKDPKKGAQIGNNKGNINGWTKAIYGKVIKIY
jgi:hypothetical protein